MRINKEWKSVLVVWESRQRAHGKIYFVKIILFFFPELVLLSCS